MIKIKKFNEGFTLLLALIVANIVLIISLGVYGIIIREIELSGLGRESQIAFYAADTGTECVLYWDIKKGGISTTTQTTIECVGQSVTVGQPGEWTQTDFKLNNFSNGACAKIVVKKHSTTEVESRGYNFECDSSLSRKVERGIKITY
jgi:Tfp pilus assembly protein PilX